MKGVKVQW